MCRGRHAVPLLLRRWQCFESQTGCLLFTVKLRIHSRSFDSAGRICHFGVRDVRVAAFAMTCSLPQPRTAPRPRAFAGRIATRSLGWLVAGLICLLTLIAPSASGVELTSGPRVSLVGTNQAEVSWTTDVPCGTRVQFGLGADRMTGRADGPVTNAHRVVLTGLRPGTTYFVSVGTARFTLATNTFVTASAGPAPPGTTSTSSPPSSVGTLPWPPASSNAPPATAWTPPPAPPTRATWGSLASLPDHFARHGRDFGAATADAYAAMAWQFRERARAQSLPMKRDDDGVVRMFDPQTRSFAAYNRDGTTKTFFKPQSRDYFERQPGRPIKPADLKFTK